MEEGIFIGIRESSNEYYVGTDKGVFKTRSIKRVPEPDRYDRDMLDTMVGIPWKMIPATEGDVITLPAIVDMPASTDDSVKVPAPLLSVPEPPRQTYIRKAAIVKFGYARNCPRCDAVKNGVKSNVLHTAECRKRIEEAMRSDDE